MAYYGIDLERARNLVGALRRLRVHVDQIERLIADAELLADMPTGCRAELAAIGEYAERSAAEIETALAVVERFRLRLPRLVAGLVAGVGRHPPADSEKIRWDASPDRPWNEVHQVASHNTYLVAGGIPELHDAGVRSFELDIHRGAPTAVLGHVLVGSGVQTIVAVAADALDHGGGTPGDWRVYHDSTGPASHYRLLSDGLAALAATEASEPVTLFVDNKDAFAGEHTGQEFDALLEQAFGPRLFGPAELRERSPRAATLREVIDRAGWPTVAELDGRVMVVLTDELDGYDRLEGRAFVAPSASFVDGTDGVVHLPEDDALFYNADAGRVGAGELAAVRATGSVIRTYFGPRCAADIVAAQPNYRAVDVRPEQPSCAAGLPSEAQQ